jgi:hypothetical protein
MPVPTLRKHQKINGEPIQIVSAVEIPNEYKPHDVDDVPAVLVDTTTIAHKRYEFTDGCCDCANR